MQCTNNLKQLALAFHNYYDEHGSLPPAYLVDEEGRPAHSWRVLILPYLDRDDLYQQYRFDEPWDGPHNRLLADQMPHVYGCPSHGHHGPKVGEHVTNYLLLCDAEGHGIARLGSDEARPPNPPRDGESSAATSPHPLGTLVPMVVEVNAESVPWMAPRDIDVASYAEVLAGEEDDFNHPAGVNVSRVDASVQFLTAGAESIEWLQQFAP